MPQPIAYLPFNGDGAEAMRFHATAFDGKLKVMMSGADSPLAAQIPKQVAGELLPL